jgi:hypothetical protein
LRLWRTYKIGLLLLLALTAAAKTASAQQVDPTREYKPMHFGISIALANAKMKTTYSESYFRTTDSLYTITPQGFPGIGFGGLVAFRLSEHLEVRTLAMLHLLQRMRQPRRSGRQSKAPWSPCSYAPNSQSAHLNDGGCQHD